MTHELSIKVALKFPSASYDIRASQQQTYNVLVELDRGHNNPSPRRDESKKLLCG